MVEKRWVKGEGQCGAGCGLLRSRVKSDRCNRISETESCRHREEVHSRDSRSEIEVRTEKVKTVERMSDRTPPLRNSRAVIESSRAPPHLIDLNPKVYPLYMLTLPCRFHTYASV